MIEVEPISSWNPPMTSNDKGNNDENNKSLTLYETYSIMPIHLSWFKWDVGNLYKCQDNYIQMRKQIRTNRTVWGGNTMTRSIEMRTASVLA